MWTPCYSVKQTDFLVPLVPGLSKLYFYLHYIGSTVRVTKLSWYTSSSCILVLAVNALSNISLHWTLNQYSVAVREYAISKRTTHACVTIYNDGSWTFTVYSWQFLTLGMHAQQEFQCLICVSVCVCLLLNNSLFMCLFVPQTILTFLAADEGRKF